MEFLEILFPNEKSADILIHNSLSIDNHHMIVLPNLPNISIINLLNHHEILVTKNVSIDSMLLCQIFSLYGDIVDIIDIENSLKSIVVFSHKKDFEKITKPQNIEIPLNSEKKASITVDYA